MSLHTCTISSVVCFSHSSFLEHAQKISIMSKKDGPSSGGGSGSVTSSSTAAATSSSTELQVLLTRTLSRQVSDAYVKLQSYDDIVAWQQTLREYQADADSDEVKDALELYIDIDYVKYVAGF